MKLTDQERDALLTEAQRRDCSVKLLLPKRTEAQARKELGK